MRAGVGLECAAHWLMLLLENLPSKITEAGTPIAAPTASTISVIVRDIGVVFVCVLYAYRDRSRRG